MDLGLSGRKAIVTGGSRGIGRAIAATLLAEGASVAICARGAEGLEEARAALQAGASGHVFAQQADIGEAAGIRGFVKAAVDALGGLDIFIHNASGMGVPGEEGWDVNYAIDVMAAVRGVDQAMAALESSDAGSIVFISSISGMEAFGFVGDRHVREGMGGPFSYGPMKAALIAYGNELAQALAPKGIRVNVISPGSIDFEGGFWGQMERDAKPVYDGVLDTIPSGRYGTAGEVARVVSFIASPAASWVTADNIMVDGGQFKTNH